MSDLLSCPFFGSSDVKQTERRNSGHGDSTCEVFVECNNCDAKGPDTGNWGSPSPGQRTEAIQKWNSRTIKEPA